MRTMRLFIAVAALALIATACGDDDAATTTQPGSTGTTTATTAGTPTTSGSAGGGANGSVTFQISGDYETSGEFPFVPQASAFSNGGWSATFGLAGSEAILVMNTIPGTLTVSYGDTEVVISGIEGAGCSFDLDQNDSNGLVGSFACSGAGFGFISQTGAMITVDFSGEVAAHP
ncbi:MAG TPA: hypothetical protein DCY40_04030 [Actinobacteria bacterium]|nr:hypothetical protein [Actinomycetota bacterium]